MCLKKSVIMDEFDNPVIRGRRCELHFAQLSPSGLERRCHACAMLGLIIACVSFWVAVHMQFGRLVDLRAPTAAGDAVHLTAIVRNLKTRANRIYLEHLPIIVARIVS